LIWHDLTAWRYYGTSTSGVALAAAPQTVSQDRLTRMLPADGSGPIRLDLAVCPWVVWQRGDVILDDTGMPNPCATAIERGAWVDARKARTPVSGCSRVVLIWTEGTLRRPRGLRLGHKGGASKYARALAWRSDARHRLRGRPAAVLFEAW
jgi:hypothetical protein